MIAALHLPGVSQVLPSLARVYSSTHAHVAVLPAPSRHSCSQLPLAVSHGVETVCEQIVSTNNFINDFIR